MKDLKRNLFLNDLVLIFSLMIVGCGTTGHSMKTYSSDQSWLEKIEENIVKSGIEIYQQRIRQSDIFEKNLEHISEYLTIPFKVNIQIKDTFFNSRITEDEYMYTLKKNREIDKIIGGTKIGPHKSDTAFYVNQNYPASQLSTGQQKTLILLLYFAQCNYLLNYCKKKPILLLDEINSHLDDFNIELLLKIIEPSDELPNNIT